MMAPTQDALDGPPCVDAFACEAPAVARALAVDPACGLPEDEVVRRRARVGDNTVPTEPPRSLVRSVVAELRETMILVLGPFLGLALPLLPAQILWVNLLTHGLPGVAFGAEQAEPDVLTRPPHPPTEGC
jgi:P-type Ca2+ transporter type 2C